MIESAVGQAGRGDEVVHRGVRIATRAERLATMRRWRGSLASFRSRTDGQHASNYWLTVLHDRALLYEQSHWEIGQLSTPSHQCRSVFLDQMAPTRRHTRSLQSLLGESGIKQDDAIFNRGKGALKARRVQPTTLSQPRRGRSEAKGGVDYLTAASNILGCSQAIERTIFLAPSR